MAIDNRSFKEIWDSLDEVDRKRLNKALMEKIPCSDTALRNYRLGNRNPFPPTQKIMIRVIKRITHIQASPKYLFPESTFAKSLKKER